MSARSASAVLLAVLLAAMASGCAPWEIGGCDSAGVEDAAKTVGGAASDDSAGEAVAVADPVMKKTAPDAVLGFVSSGGVVLDPPPKSWKLSYISPSSGPLYVLDVEHGKPGAPRELGKAAGAEVTPIQR